MRISQTALVVFAAGAGIPAAAYVVNPVRGQYWGQHRNTRLKNSMDHWRIPGKPAGHPDHMNNHIIELGPEQLESSREVARSFVGPLEEENREVYRPPPRRQTPTGLDSMRDAIIYVGENISRRDERRDERRDDTNLELHENEASKKPRFQPKPLVADPERIMGDQKDDIAQKEVAATYNDAEKSSSDDFFDQMAAEGATPEEIYEAKTRRDSEDAAKRVVAEASKIKREEEEARIMMKQKSIEDAKRMNAERSKQRAEREEAMFKSQEEARQRGIEAARQMKLDAAKRAEEQNVNRIAADKAREQAAADAQRRIEERARAREEEEARMMADERNLFTAGAPMNEDPDPETDEIPYAGSFTVPEDRMMTAEAKPRKVSDYNIDDLMTIIG